VKRALGLFLVIGLSACGGGSTGQTVPSTSKSLTGSSTPTSAALKIVVPNVSATAASKRRAAYVSSATQSLTIDITSSPSQAALPGFPMTVNVTPSSTGCASTASGTVCTFALDLAVGAYNATVTAFDGHNGTGDQLSAAQSVPFTVVQNQTNTLPLVLGGTPASIVIAAGSNVAAAHLSVYTLPGNASGTLMAYGVDADGDTIVGPGTPTITATTDDATQITVTQPTSAAPNAIGLTSLGARAIAHITATETPLAGAGGATLSQTITVQAPSLPLLYLATYGMFVFDMTGTNITPAGSAFANLNVGPGGSGLTYDTANGFLYAADQNGASSFVLAFDRNGNQQPLNAGASGLPSIGGLAYDPSTGWIYATGENFALDATGNQHALTTTLPFFYGPTYDPQQNAILDGAELYNGNGTAQSGYGFTGQFWSATYNAFNGWFYVATVYPTMVTAYDTSGAVQTLSGTFIDNSTEQIGAIVADPTSGNIFIATNASKTYGFDSNGNPLPPPWHTIVGKGSASGAAGLAITPP
jgi:hypothetical protein